MMNLSLAAFLVFPAIGGYLFSKEWAISELEVAREDGHKLYFRSGFYGLNLFILSYGLYFLVKQLIYLVDFYRHGGCFSDLAVNPTLLWPSSTEYQTFTLVTVWLGPLLSWFINKFGNKLPAYRNFASKRFHKLLEKRRLEKLLWDANQAQLPVAFTMDTGLVFIGYWKASSSPTDKRNMIQILPAASGYRDEDGALVIRTVYEEVYQKVDDGKLKHLKTEYFLKVIDGDHIVAANMFDIDAYIAFSEAQHNSVGNKKRDKN